MSSQAPRTYLIVCCRYIGDVLVTTPLALSIKTADPDAIVDYLVFEGTEGILDKNPHVRTVHTIPNKKASIGKLFSLYRQYDVAIAAYPSDRTVVAAAIAGRYAIGLSYKRKNEWWKQFVLNDSFFCDSDKHVVVNILSLLAPLKIIPMSRLVVDVGHLPKDLEDFIASCGNYIVFHPYSRSSYKCCPATVWAKLARKIVENTDFKVLITRTPGDTDTLYLQSILALSPSSVLVMPTVCSLGELATVIRTGSAYIGVDTVMTHVAASQGIPTIALFGPTLTSYWGPWPQDCNEQSTPYKKVNGVQRVANITVMQKNWDCVPCNMEKCVISQSNEMVCLEEVDVEEVFMALKASIG